MTGLQENKANDKRGRQPETVASDLAAAFQRRMHAIKQQDWSAVTRADQQITTLQTEWDALKQAQATPADEEWAKATRHLQQAEQAAAEATAWLQNALRQTESDMAALPRERERLAAYLRASARSE